MSTIVRCVAAGGVPQFVRANRGLVLTDAGRLLARHVGEISGAIAYLAGQDSSFVTGTELIIDGGYLAR